MNHGGDLRILEYAALGISVLASEVLPYSNAPVIRLANTPDAWIRQILADAAQPEALPERGRILQQWVADKFSLDDMASKWLEALAG